MNSSKRFHLSLIAKQTQRLLFSLLLGASAVLFIGQLFLMNQLALGGYALTLEAEKQVKLVQKKDALEIKMAQLQTQEFLKKSGQVQTLTVRNDLQTYVSIPNQTYTAQNSLPNQNRP
jgi:hypothetical protein